MTKFGRLLAEFGEGEMNLSGPLTGVRLDFGVQAESLRQRVNYGFEPGLALTVEDFAT